MEVCSSCLGADLERWGGSFCFGSGCCLLVGRRRAVARSCPCGHGARACVLPLGLEALEGRAEIAAAPPVEGSSTSSELVRA
eukprot:3257975-Pyramimonas_sp.AAC.1